MSERLDPTSGDHDTLPSDTGLLRNVRKVAAFMLGLRATADPNSEVTFRIDDNREATYSLGSPLGRQAIVRWLLRGHTPARITPPKR